jgi:hypothetical protein
MKKKHFKIASPKSLCRNAKKKSDTSIREMRRMKVGRCMLRNVINGLSK